ncbi:uncharacterized protein VTP21DRAFT_2330 [Calcarisporiella thermophila]|uniref:uncharacterized protein n=1 Tax=Calcarisporiella thermophila TaxID=911321 RepID=UPI0037440164
MSAETATVHAAKPIIQLPGFLRDPAVALITEPCYVSLVERLNLQDTPCLKLAISKGLSVGMVLGGAIVKIPQIITILRHRSAQGLSLPAYYLETLACAITLFYNLNARHPFTTFGEVAFLTVQNAIITLMILYYSQRRGLIAATVVGMLAIVQGLRTMPSAGLASFQAATIPLNLMSRVPQIYANYQNGSTGHLSAFAVFNYFCGSVARVFTTATELDDPLLLLGNALAAVFNGIIALQMIYYWNTPVKKEEVREKLQRKRRD